MGENTAVLRSKALVNGVRHILNQEPTIDLALVTLAHALNLPYDAPLVLFALGRTVGWLGHAIEQYQRDQLIRPRAKYIGKKQSEVV